MRITYEEIKVEFMYHSLTKSFRCFSTFSVFLFFLLLFDTNNIARTNHGLYCPQNKYLTIKLLQYTFLLLEKICMLQSATVAH